MARRSRKKKRKPFKLSRELARGGLSYKNVPNHCVTVYWPGEPVRTWAKPVVARIPATPKPRKPRKKRKPRSERTPKQAVLPISPSVSRPETLIAMGMVHADQLRDARDMVAMRARAARRRGTSRAVIRDELSTGRVQATRMCLALKAHRGPW